MKIMSVDLGNVRTGIALSDEGESFAFPKCVITERNSEKLVSKIVQKAFEYGAGMLVIGRPVNMDGSSGFRAEECSELALKISEASGLTVHLWDERCTTVLAHNTLSMNDVRGKKRKETVDAVAAVLILESYLSYRKNQN